MEALLPLKKMHSVMCSETSGIVGPISLGDIVTAEHHLHVLQEELLPFL
jgi:hypothetical protein